MSGSSSRNGPHRTTVDDLLDTTGSVQDEIESKGKKTMKMDSDNRRSPDARRRHKSSSRKYIRRSPSRSAESRRSTRITRSSESRRNSPASRSRRSTRTARSSESRRNSPAFRSRSKIGRDTTHDKSGMSNKTRVISERQILEIEGIDMEFKSLSLKAEDELSNRHRNGEIYDEVSANLRSIKKRLKHLSKNNRTFSIDEAIEISDAAFLLKILRKPKPEIEMAGQMAHRGALLMLQADLLKEKGRELLAQSKHKLRMADL